MQIVSKEKQVQFGRARVLPKNKEQIFGMPELLRMFLDHPDCSSLASPIPQTCIGAPQLSFWESERCSQIKENNNCKHFRNSITFTHW